MTVREVIALNVLVIGLIIAVTAYNRPVLKSVEVRNVCPVISIIPQRMEWRI